MCWIKALVITIFVSIVSMTGLNAKEVKPIYELYNTLSMPGSVRWDYLTYDCDRHHLYITRGDSVDILDTQTNKIIGSISATQGAHGVAINSKLKRGYISNGKLNSITIFDLENFQILSTLAVGMKPDAIVFDKSSNLVFVANGDSHTMSVVDTSLNSVLATLELKGKPEFIVTDEKGRIFVNIEDLSQIVTIDTKKLVEQSRYNLKPDCEGPTGLSMDRIQERLFVSCHNKTMLVMDAQTGARIATLPIGASSDATIYDEGNKLALSSNGVGTLSVVAETKPKHYEVVEELKTMPTARTMALDPLTHTLYLAAADIEGLDVPSKSSPYPRPRMKPESFKILVMTWNQKTAND